MFKGIALLETHGPSQDPKPQPGVVHKYVHLSRDVATKEGGLIGAEATWNSYTDTQVRGQRLAGEDPSPTFKVFGQSNCVQV